MKWTAFVCSVVLLGGLAAHALADGPTPSADCAALVRQLGAPSYEARESASQRLRQLGKVAVPAVRAGLKDTDAEVRRRCAALLPTLDRPELEPRLASLLDGADTFTPPLPGWEKFREAAGSDTSARLLYIDLYQADRAWLELVQRDPAQAATLISSRVQALQRKLIAARAAADDLRVSSAELAALFLADSTGNLQSFYALTSLVYQQDIQVQVRGNVALRRLIERCLARRCDDPNAFYQVVSVARMLELKEFIDGSLRTSALRRLESALSQPVDLNRLAQASYAIGNLEMQDQVPERVKGVLRELAGNVAKQPLDLTRVHQVFSLLQVLRMHDTIDKVLKPGVYQLARATAETTPDVNRFHQVLSLCQLLNLPEGIDVLKPAACKLVAEAANRPDDQMRFSQAVTLSQSLGLTEALEGVVKPAARKQVLAALERPDDLAGLSRACNLAVRAQLDLIEDTLKPALRRQVKALLDGPVDLNRVRVFHDLAQQVGARDIIDEQVKPALGKALLEAARGPVNQSTLDHSLYLARQLNVKEGAALALKGAQSRGLPAHTRANAILFVSALGTAEQMRQLEPLLSDTAAVGSFHFNGAMLTAEVRDVVLASLVFKSGQQLAEYGFSPLATLGAAGPFGTSPAFFGFAGAAERDKAQAKWKAWCADQKK